MSTPEDPYAAPGAWSSYGGPQHGQPPYAAGGGYAGFGTPPQPTAYAHWGQRAAAYVIDWLILAACTIPLFVGLGLLAAVPVGDTGVAAVGAVLVIVGVLLPLAFWVWNYWREGTTGRTLGKRALGLQVRREGTGALLGGWLSLGRQILHTVDGALCYLGYLWPLWDDKRQTFADKIVGTVVICAPR